MMLGFTLSKRAVVNLKKASLRNDIPNLYTAEVQLKFDVTSHFEPTQHDLYVMSIALLKKLTGETG